MSIERLDDSEKKKDLESAKEDCTKQVMFERDKLKFV